MISLTNLSVSKMMNNKYADTVSLTILVIYLKI